MRAALVGKNAGTTAALRQRRSWTRAPALATAGRRRQLRVSYQVVITTHYAAEPRVCLTIRMVASQGSLGNIKVALHLRTQLAYKPGRVLFRDNVRMLVVYM
jgi:hypothetical protein